jgi:hypothetical protein
MSPDLFDVHYVAIAFLCITKLPNDIQKTIFGVMKQSLEVWVTSCKPGLLMCWV